MYYKKLGSGKKIIIALHGWGQNKDTFDPIFTNEGLKHATIYCLDMPGFGDCPEPDYPYTIPDYAKFVLDFMDKHKIQQASFIGHSFGCRVITEIAYTNNQRVDNICYMGAAGIRPKMNIFSKCKQITYKVIKAILKSSLYNKNRTKYLAELNFLFGSTDYNNASGTMKKTVVNVINYDQKKQLATIKNSTLLIWGRDDDQTPYKDGKLFNALLSNSVMHTYDYAGHYVFLDKKDEVSKLITAFIEGDWNAMNN